MIGDRVAQAAKREMKCEDVLINRRGEKYSEDYLECDVLKIQCL
jgi:hypothetical protein